MTENLKVQGAWKFYLGFYTGFRFQILGAVLTAIFQSVMILPVALLIRGIFDQAIPENKFKTLVIYCLIIISLYILDGFLTLITRYLSLKTSKTVIRNLRDVIISKIYSFPRPYFDQTDKIKLQSCIVQDTLRIDIMSNALVSQLLPVVLICCGLSAVLVYLNLYLFLVIFIAAPIVLIAGQCLGRRLKARINTYHQLFNEFSKRILVMLNIIDLTKIRDNEPVETARQKKVHRALQESSFIQAWFNSVYRIFHKTAVASIGLVILIIGGYLIVKGKMSVGELIAFFAAIGLLRNNIMVAVNVMPQVIEGNESLKVIYNLLNTREELPYSGSEKIDFSGQISFKNVDFSYNEEKVLLDISFDLYPGTITCFWGNNGSGKSTVANLILGFYQPDCGIILADGQSYKNLDLKQLRSNFGVVQQDPVIFPGTIQENLTYGCPDVSLTSINRALELSGCSDFISRLPKGLGTEISSNKQPVSGGEVQRLAIARSLLKNYKLLILDEPNNHLDPGAITKILENIRQLIPHPTVMYISNNPEVARGADQVIIMERGRILIQGKPQDMPEFKK